MILINTLLVFMAALVVTIAATGDGEVNLEKGLVFLQRDTVLMTADSWCVAINIDLQSYIDNVRAFQKMANSFQPDGAGRFGANYSSVDTEIMWVAEKNVFTLRSKAEQLVNDVIDLQDSMLSVATNHRSQVPNPGETLPSGPRVPRGILNIGGHVLNFLFGVLTTTHYEELNTKIESLQGSNKEIQHVISEQLSIVNHSYFVVNEMKSKVNKVSTEIKFLQQDLISTQQAIRDEFARIEKRFIYLSRTTRVTNTLESLFDKLHADIQRLKHAYMYASLGKLDTYFLPYDSYMTLAKQVQASLPAGRELVTHDTSGLMRLYYSLATLSAFLLNFLCLILSAYFTSMSLCLCLQKLKELTSSMQWTRRQSSSQSAKVLNIILPYPKQNSAAAAA